MTCDDKRPISDYERSLIRFGVTELLYQSVNGKFPDLIGKTQTEISEIVDDVVNDAVLCLRNRPATAFS